MDRVKNVSETQVTNNYLYVDWPFIATDGTRDWPRDSNENYVFSMENIQTVSRDHSITMYVIKNCENVTYMKFWKGLVQYHFFGTLISARVLFEKSLLIRVISSLRPRVKKIWVLYLKQQDQWKLNPAIFFINFHQLYDTHGALKNQKDCLFMSKPDEYTTVPQFLTAYKDGTLPDDFHVIW